MSRTSAFTLHHVNLCFTFFFVLVKKTGIRLRWKVGEARKRVRLVGRQWSLTLNMKHSLIVVGFNLLNASGNGSCGFWRWIKRHNAVTNVSGRASVSYVVMGKVGMLPRILIRRGLQLRRCNSLRMFAPR